MGRRHSFVRIKAESYEKDANLFVQVFDDEEHGTVQSSHLSVQSLQAAPVDTCAVHQLPRVALSPCRHVSCKLWQKTLGIKIYPTRSKTFKLTISFI